MSQYPPFPNREDSIPDAGLDDLLRFEHTDRGFGDLFSHIQMGRIKFDPTLQNWLFWRRHWWEPDTRGEIIQKVNQSADVYKQATTLIVDEDRKTACEKFQKGMQSVARITPMLQMARTLPQIVSDHDLWNKNMDLLGIENGVMDLRSGSVREGFPQDLISLHAEVTYDPKATCPRWLQFLEEIFPNQPEMNRFVHKAVGYSLTGRTIEQCLFLLVGDGSNGKSVFLDVITTLLGVYGYSAPFDSFTRNLGSSGIGNDLAAMDGRRLVTASETNEGSTLNESRIKELTGGQKMNARFLNHEFFEFRPVCKIWLGVNHAPRVLDDSDGFWRRVRRIEFLAKFMGEKRDPNLAEKLKKESQGILSWALEGAKLWYREGLGIPKSVEAATSSYRDDSDPLHSFIEEHCNIGSSESIGIDDIFRAYINDGKAKFVKSYELISSSRFHQRMVRAYSKSEESGRKAYTGIGLKMESRHLLLSDSNSVVVSRPIQKR